MSEFADIAQRGRDLLVAAQLDVVLGTSYVRAVGERSRRFADLINANFDLRDRNFHVAEENRRMVMTARSVGASAKFAGSGGAIVGTYEDDTQFAALVHALGAIGCQTIRPTVA